MHRPSVSELLRDNESYYSLVLAVAKRARDLVETANEEGEIIIEKPVSLAVDDFYRGRVRLIESARIGEETE